MQRVIGGGQDDGAPGGGLAHHDLQMRLLQLRQRMGQFAQLFAFQGTRQMHEELLRQGHAPCGQGQHTRLIRGRVDEFGLTPGRKELPAIQHRIKRKPSAFGGQNPIEAGRMLSTFGISDLRRLGIA